MSRLAIAAVATLCCACSAHRTPLQQALMAHVTTLAAPSMRGRKAGTGDEARARNYVTAALEQARIGPPPGGRVQRFRLADGKESANVYGLVEGATGLSDEYVVIGAHVDHLGVVDGELHLGAEDNATGVALVLEVGAVLRRRQRELGRSVLLAFFGAEEVGKVGSRAYLTDPPVPLGRTVAMLNVDMIGLPLLDQSALWILERLWGLDDARSVGIVGTAGRPGLRAIVNQGCFRAGIASVAPEDFPGFIEDMINAQALDRSDDAPFRRAGIPAVFFGSGEADSYHSPDDVVGDIVPEILASRTLAVLETAVLLSRVDWSFVRSRR